jgi:RimJ/RimL family protein N-acetyltransferase
MTDGGCILAPVENEHFEQVLAWFDHPAFYYRTKRPDSETFATVRTMVFPERAVTFRVIADGRAVGLCGYERGAMDGGTVDIHLRIARDDDWRCFGARGLHAIVEFVFGTTGAVRLQAKMHSFDEVGTRLFDKSAFAREAVLREAVFKRGNYHDVALYSLLRGEYRPGTAVKDLFGDSATDPYEGFEFPEAKSMLRSKKISLRRIHPRDADLITEWKSGELYNRNIAEFGVERSKERSRNGVLANIENPGGNEIEFIVEAADGRAIGLAWLRSISMDDKRAEALVLIGDEEYLGMGYGFLADVMLRNFAFFELGLHKIMAGVSEANTQMIRSIELRKDRITARYPDRVLKNGKRYDKVVISAINPLHGAMKGKPEECEPIPNSILLAPTASQGGSNERNG